MPNRQNRWNVMNLSTLFPSSKNIFWLSSDNKPTTSARKSVFPDSERVFKIFLYSSRACFASKLTFMYLPVNDLKLNLCDLCHIHQITNIHWLKTNIHWLILSGKINLVTEISVIFIYFCGCENHLNHVCLTSGVNKKVSWNSGIPRFDLLLLVSLSHIQWNF